MNFFEHQDQARRQTRRMLFLFALAVVAVVAATDVLVLFAIGLDSTYHARDGFSWGVIGALSVAIAFAIGLGSAYRIATLGGGGASIAQDLGATRVDPGTTNFAYRRLRNVVEEIAIASGVPVPQIFVLESEAGINAFAAGYTPADAAITVTRGALDKLTREELQGVIGHEFSHVLNGDMRLNIRLVGVVFGILVLATIGRKIARTRDRAALFGVALFCVGYIGVVCARLIKASIARQREFLADASAVQFTRQTDGIAGALKKIGALAEGSKLASADTEEVAHMLFSDGVGYSALFATHPPLEERIRRLDPGFRPDELKEIAAAWSQPVLVADETAADIDGDPELSIAGFAPASGARRRTRMHEVALPSPDASIAVTPAAVIDQVGHPDTEDRRSAAAIRTTIPESLREAAYRQEQAAPLIFALVLDAREDIRAKQRAVLAAHYDEGASALAETLAADVATLHPMLRLPLASLAFPALRRRPRPQLATFIETLNALIAADGDVDLHEYCLGKLVALQVVEALAPAAASAIGRVRLPEVEADAAALLAIVARHGHDDADAAERAFLAAIGDVLPGRALPYVPPQDWIGALDRALPRLDRLSPAGKELVIGALVRAISEDGATTVAEAELLRTIAAALHCPLPPLIANPLSTSH
jgi:Zn-dependent protease with chaperone function